LILLRAEVEVNSFLQPFRRLHRPNKYHHFTFWDLLLGYSGDLGGILTICEYFE
jgi:hypothetical protein